MRAVEAVDLVDEQAACPARSRGARGRHRTPFSDRRRRRRSPKSARSADRSLGQQPRHRGLAGAGRPPEDQRAERARLQHARQDAVGTEQMILPDHVGERIRPQLVGERPRRVVLEAGGGEEVRSSSFGLESSMGAAPGERRLFLPPRMRGRRKSSAQHDGNLLAAAIDGDAPGAAAGAGDALEVGRSFDLLVVDRDDDVALLEPDRLRRRAVGDARRWRRPCSADRSAARRPAPATDWRPWRRQNGERDLISTSSRGASGTG